MILSKEDRDYWRRLARDPEWLCCASRVNAMLDALDEREIAHKDCHEVDTELIMTRQQLATAQETIARLQQCVDDDLLTIARLSDQASTLRTTHQASKAWLELHADDVIKLKAQLATSEKEHLEAVRDRDNARELAKDLNKNLATAQDTIAKQKDALDFAAGEIQARSDQIVHYFQALSTIRTTHQATVEALRKALNCIEIQNMHSWDECNTVEEAIEKGFWCKLAIDTRASIQHSLGEGKGEG